MYFNSVFIVRATFYKLLSIAQMNPIKIKTGILHPDHSPLDVRAKKISENKKK